MQFRMKNDQNETNERHANVIDNFLQTFSSFPKTNWIVRKSFPPLKRLLFRKRYTPVNIHRSTKKVLDTKRFVL